MPVKDTFIAYLLLFTFSILGIHKFYLGRPGMGFLYFFTFGIVGIGVLYDLFTLPSQVRLVNLQNAALNKPQVVVQQVSSANDNPSNS